MILARVILVSCLALASAGAEAMTGIRDIVCMERDALVGTLTDEQGKVPVGQGLAGDAALVEVWANPVTGDWTLVQTHAGGQSCIAALGGAWDVGASPEDPS